MVLEGAWQLHKVGRRDPYDSEGRWRNINGISAAEIAKVLTETTRVEVLTSSVQGALSGMYACDGRYWSDHLSRKRIRINKHGRAWLQELDLL